MSTLDERHGRKPEPKNLNLLRHQIEKFVEHEAFSAISKVAGHLCDGWNDVGRVIWLRLNAPSSSDIATMIQTVVRVVVEIIN